MTEIKLVLEVVWLFPAIISGDIEQAESVGKFELNSYETIAQCNNAREEMMSTEPPSEWVDTYAPEYVGGRQYSLECEGAAIS